MSGLPLTSPTIEVIVNTDGSTVVQTHGFVGRTCQSATAFLERALGHVTNERPTSEFYEQAAAHEREHETS